MEPCQAHAVSMSIAAGRTYNFQGLMKNSAQRWSGAGKVTGDLGINDTLVVYFYCAGMSWIRSSWPLPGMLLHNTYKRKGCAQWFKGMQQRRMCLLPPSSRCRSWQSCCELALLWGDLTLLNGAGDPTLLNGAQSLHL